jgi:hypothetical protein
MIHQLWITLHHHMFNHPSNYPLLKKYLIFRSVLIFLLSICKSFIFYPKSLFKKTNYISFTLFRFKNAKAVPLSVFYVSLYISKYFITRTISILYFLIALERSIYYLFLNFKWYLALSWSKYKIY